MEKQISAVLQEVHLHSLPIQKCDSTLDGKLDLLQSPGGTIFMGEDVLGYCWQFSQNRVEC